MARDNGTRYWRTAAGRIVTSGGGPRAASGDKLDCRYYPTGGCAGRLRASRLTEITAAEAEADRAAHRANARDRWRGAKITLDALRGESDAAHREHVAVAHALADERAEVARLKDLLSRTCGPVALEELRRQCRDAETKARLAGEETARLKAALQEQNRLFEKLDEAMAPPERIARDTEAAGGFVSGLDLTETAEGIAGRAAACIAALRGCLARGLPHQAACVRLSRDACSCGADDVAARAREALSGGVGIGGCRA